MLRPRKTIDAAGTRARLDGLQAAVRREAEGAAAENRLCLTIDGYTGRCTQAPTNSVYRFNEMAAACADIAERWPSIRPPDGAVLQG